MSFIDPTNQGIQVFIAYLDSLSLPDGSNPGTRVLKSAAVVSVPASVKIEDTAGNPLTSTAGSLNVNITGGTGDVVSINQTTPGVTNGVVVNSSALPTGASTSALQTSGNSSLTSIAAGTPTSLGQKTMANSMSVVIASDQSVVPVSLPTGVNTYTSSNATVSGSVGAGAKSVGALFSSDFIGSFNGATRVAGSSASVSADQGKTLPAIPYTIAAGSIILDVIS
jgi:hypothetical protein